MDAFYVKPLACWIPHVLIPNHVPTCPHCKEKKFVNPQKARWINSPKILYGKDRHRYMLDKFGDLARIDAAHQRLEAMGRDVGIDFRFEHGVEA